MNLSASTSYGWSVGRPVAAFGSDDRYDQVSCGNFGDLYTNGP